MADMRHMYSPPGLTTEAKSTTPRAFQLKFLNIMDPLLPTNNLGRSVNKSSFARIRRALDYGAKRLDSILKKVDSPAAIKSLLSLNAGGLQAMEFPMQAWAGGQMKARSLAVSGRL